MVKRYKVICPLINLNIPNVLIGHSELSPEEVFREQEKKLVEGIDLFDGVKIRRISKEDLEDLKNSIFPILLDTVVSPNMFVLEKYITTEDGHDFQLDQTMRNTILAMRLLKNGFVSGNCIYYVLVSEKLKKFISVELSCEGGYRRLEPWVSKYVLYIDEIPALKKKIEKLQGIDFANEKRLHLACKRFQRAYEEGDFEDQLIDFIIAFEALFVRREIKRKGEKIANDCSELLGKNDEEKEQIRSFLTKAYSIRNHIVHGGEYDKYISEYDMVEFVSKTEDYLRESLNKLLD